MVARNSSNLWRPFWCPVKSLLSSKPLAACRGEILCRWLVFVVSNSNAINSLAAQQAFF